MNKRLVYGGMATAMVVVLATSASVVQMSTRSGGGDAARETNLVSTATPQIQSIDSGGLDTSRTPRKERQLADKKDAGLRSREQGRLDNYRFADEQSRIKGNKAKNEEGRMAQRPALMEEAESFEYDTPAAVVADAISPIGKTQALNTPAESKRMIAQGFVGGEAGAVIAMSPPVITGDDIVSPDYYKDVGRDQFEDFEENPITLVSEVPVSTFSIDVDTASYSFMRNQINNGLLPQKDAVRIEEMINYFDYDYPQPETKEVPFEHNVTVVPSPWKEGNKLVHIGIKGYDIDEQPRSNLVFLLDVSGSMNNPNKLPLVKNSMKLLLDTLQPDDTIGIVVYAGAAGTVLEPTKVSDKGKILKALDRLSAGGSTAGAEGIRQAYQLAETNFDDEAVNRVILATDGDFNVGITNRDELKDFVERKRETGIFLSVLGFGQGNYNDHLMQELAQNGNGVAAYIDSLNEARKVLVDEATSTLFPIAKDVKIQVEFNPETVAEYRLVGYETRHLEREDFNNDAIDAGDIGAGHTVTAIYEIAPVGQGTIDESRYAQKTEAHEANTEFGTEYAFLKMRYKLPDEDKSKLITTPIQMDSDATATMLQETNWATAVATFGQLLKGGKHTGDMNYDAVINLAQKAKGTDEFGYRAEFINLVRLAKSAADLQDTQP